MNRLLRRWRGLQANNALVNTKTLLRPKALNANSDHAYRPSAELAITGAELNRHRCANHGVHRLINLLRREELAIHTA
jgi:hypothetical protein